MRIAKYLASCAIASRRKAEEFITNGSVKINGEVINKLSYQVDPEIDIVEINGEICEPKEKVYYLLNKPAGYTSTLKDPHAKNIITELIPNDTFLWPVGRLDRETEGLIILTNDGEITQRLTHPKYDKRKEYIATIKNDLTTEQSQELFAGIILEDGPFKPDKFEKTGENEYKIVIHEGRNRLIRRVFEYFGSKVTKLVRTKIMNLDLKGLKRGEYRTLTEKEIKELKNA